MPWYSGCARITSRASDSMPSSGVPARYLRQASKKLSRTCPRLGSNMPGLLPELAQVADQALRAAGLAREADVAPVQDQPVVRVLQELGRRELDEALLDFARIATRSELRAVGDAEDVRVDGHRRLPEGRVEHHVGRLAADAGQALEGLALGGHLAAVLAEQDPGQGHHV